MLRKFYSDVGYMAIFSIVVRAKDLAAIPLLTFYAGPELFGAWSQAGLVVAFATPLVSLGLRQGLVRYAAGLSEGVQASQFSALLVVTFSVSTMLAVGVLAFPGALERLLFGGEDRHRTLLLVVTVLVLVHPVRGAFETLYLMQGRAKAVAILRFVNALGLLTVICWFVWRDLGFVKLVASMVLVEASFVGLLGLIFLRRFGRVWPDFSWCWAGLRFGVPLLPGSLAMFGVHFMDRLILPVFGFTIGDLGVYAFGYSIAQVALNFATMPFKTIYGNRAAGYFNEGQMDELRQLCRHTLTATITLGLPAVVCLFVLGDAIAATLAPPQFSRAAELMGFIGVGYLAQSLAKVYRVNIGLTMGTHHVLVILLITCVVNLLLNVALIPSFGLLGAALATMCALICAAVLSARVAGRGFRVNLDPRVVGWVVAAAAVLAVSIVLVRLALAEVIEGSVARSVVAGAVGIALYAAILAREGNRHLRPVARERQR